MCPMQHVALLAHDVQDLRDPREGLAELHHLLVLLLLLGLHLGEVLVLDVHPLLKLLGGETRRSRHDVELVLVALLQEEMSFTRSCSATMNEPGADTVFSSGLALLNQSGFGPQGR